ncbi:hypothetical protein ABZ953_30380 [Streptomyces sp. NPDC046465]
MGPLGLNGIMINSHTEGRYLDDDRFAPLMAAAEAHRAPSTSTRACPAC